MDIRQFIINVLSETFIAEVDETKHSMERLYQRIINPSEIEVGYEKGIGEYEEVGTYVLPENIKTQILDRLNNVKNKRTPTNKAFAIKLVDVFINPANVHYYPWATANDVRGKQLVFMLKDSEGTSYGNTLYVISRGNQMATILWGRNLQPEDAKRKFRVDYAVKDVANIR